MTIRTQVLQAVKGGPGSGRKSAPAEIDWNSPDALAQLKEQLAAEDPEFYRDSPPYVPARPAKAKSTEFKKPTLRQIRRRFIRTNPGSYD